MSNAAFAAETKQARERASRATGVRLPVAAKAYEHVAIIIAGWLAAWRTRAR